MKAQLSISTIAILLSFQTYSTELVTFKSGTPAKASEVNSNFNSLKKRTEANSAAAENLSKSIESKLIDVNGKITLNTQAVNSLNSNVESKLNDVNGKITLNTQAVNSLNSNVASKLNDVNGKITLNTQAVNSLNSNVESKLNDVNEKVDTNTTAIETIINNTFMPRAFEDLNGLLFGKTIGFDRSAESAVVILDSIDMVVGVTITDGRVSNEVSFSYAEKNCQGQAYSRIHNDLFSLSRVSENGSIIGYKVSTDEIIYAPPKVAVADTEILSGEYSTGECHNYDDNNIRTEKLYIASSMPRPDTLVWQCENGEEKDDCQKSLYLKGDAPFFITR